jgi:hypothetical protein
VKIAIPMFQVVEIALNLNCSIYFKIEAGHSGHTLYTRIMKYMYKLHFFPNISDMSSDSEVYIDAEAHPSLDELKLWKVAELKEWFLRSYPKDP